MNRYLIDLDNAAADDVQLVGGKARGLHRLRAAGLPTPPGFVVTTDAYRCCTSAGHTEDTGFIRPDGPTDAALPVAAEPDRPPLLHEALGHHLAAVGPMPVDGWAVRSSGVDEDAEHHSAAGVYETVLGISDDAVAIAVTQCWDSLWTERARSHRHRTDATATQTPEMAVVVQPLCVGTSSAIVFTRDPIGCPAQLRVEAAVGMGESLVAGRSVADCYVLDRVSLRIVDRQAGAHDEPPTEDRLSIDDDEARSLSELALRAERAFGFPLDMEATLVEGAWILLQARPITRAAG